MSEPVPSKTLVGDEVLADPLVHELLTAPLIGVFATLGQGGTIHAVPMWFALHERSILLATGARSRKVQNLEVDSRGTLVVHDSRPGFEVCGASIAGTVEIVRPPRAQALVDLVHERYLLSEAARDPTVEAFLASDDVALRLTPAASVTWDQRASEAAEIVSARGWALPLVPTEPRL
jgi:hypothetical protein